MATTLVYITYPIASVVVVLFGVFAMAVSWFVRDKNKSHEFFLTARNTAGVLRIMWSFYAGALGSWALFGPPSYAIYAGTLGVIMYAIATGLPVIGIALLGGRISRKMPNVLSLSDYVGARFGLLAQLYVSLLTLFNMSIAMIAEYTSVGDLFASIIGTTRVPIVILIGVVTTVYTAFGGLYVSLITDQYQAMTSIVVVLILVGYIAATFRYPLGPLPSSPFDLTFSNPDGLGSIAVMPISLMSSTIYSEAMWQRCWASETEHKLLVGALLAFVLIVAVVFFFGFCGVLAIWSGLFTPTSDYNTILFLLLSDSNGELVTWVVVLVSVLSVTMTESAIDSLQNAVVDTISSVLLKNRPVLWTRVLVFLINVPLVVVALQGYNIIQLFLMANLITTTSSTPILIGLWDRGRPYINQWCALFGCACGIASLFVWTAIEASADGISYGEALNVVFYQSYAWQPFIIALVTSTVAVLAAGALVYLVSRIWPSLAAPHPLPLSDSSLHSRGSITNGHVEGKLDPDAPDLVGKDVIELDAPSAHLQYAVPSGEIGALPGTMHGAFLNAPNQAKLYPMKLIHL